MLTGRVGGAVCGETVSGEGLAGIVSLSGSVSAVTGSRSDGVV